MKSDSVNTSQAICPRACLLKWPKFQVLDAFFVENYSLKSHSLEYHVEPDLQTNKLTHLQTNKLTHLHIEIKGCMRSKHVDIGEKSWKGGHKTKKRKKNGGVKKYSDKIKQLKYQMGTT